MEETAMGTVRSHEDLTVWQKSMDLAVEVYRLVASLPKTELYGLSSQTTRAATSVAANIAEGHGRSSTRDFLRFLGIARGSLMEVQTLLSLAVRLSYLSECRTACTPIDEISRMLSSLRQSLRRRLQSNGGDGEMR
jgi:four helix bundle protein